VRAVTGQRKSKRGKQGKKEGGKKTSNQFLKLFLCARDCRKDFATQAF